MKIEITMKDTDLSQRLKFGQDGKQPHIDLSDLNTLLQRASITHGTLFLEIEGK